MDSVNGAALAAGTGTEGVLALFRAAPRPFPVALRRHLNTYDVTYGDGPMGLSFGKRADGAFVVSKSTLQSEQLGVVMGHRIAAINGELVRATHEAKDVVGMLKKSDRPLTITLTAKPQVRAAATVAKAALRLRRALGPRGRAPTEAAAGVAAGEGAGAAEMPAARAPGKATALATLTPLAAVRRLS